MAVERFAADHGKEVDTEKAANERACLTTRAMQLPATRLVV